MMLKLDFFPRVLSKIVGSLCLSKARPDDFTCQCPPVFNPKYLLHAFFFVIFVFFAPNLQINSLKCINALYRVLNRS